MKTRISFTIVLGVLLLALLAGAAKAKPGTPPPNVAGTTSEPPAAWFQANGRAAWFAYSSFCWTTACVDFLRPRDAPTFLVHRSVRDRCSRSIWDSSPGRSLPAT